MDEQDHSFEVALIENSTEECAIKTENPFDGQHSINTETLEPSSYDYPIKIEAIKEDLGAETQQDDDDTLLEDPLEPTLRKQPLDTQAKLMLLNVIRYFQKFRLLRAKETGEDMNVNAVVAEATGVSESAVKKLLWEYRDKGIERAIRPPARTRVRKRKNDIVVEVEEDFATVTVQKKRKKPSK